MPKKEEENFSLELNGFQQKKKAEKVLAIAKKQEAERKKNGHVWITCGNRTKVLKKP